MNDSQDISFTVSLSITDSNTAGTDCGSHKPAIIKKLMRDLASTPVPLTSCVFSLSARYTQENSARMYTNSNGGLYQPSPHHSASFYIVHRNCRKCERDKCITNISSGKCCDEFIKNTLGVTLFPNHYAKQK